MSALQLWLQNHNRRLTQDAIDEALMEYITHVESQRDALMKQRDELVKVLEQIVASNPRKWEELAEPQSEFERWAKSRANHAIASVKEKQDAAD